MEDSPAKSYKGWLMITLGDTMIKDCTLNDFIENLVFGRSWGSVHRLCCEIRPPYL